MEKKIVKKTFSNIEALNIDGWFNQVKTEHKDKLSKLPFSINASLRRNMQQITEAIQPVKDIREDMMSELREKYFTADKTHEVEIEDNKQMVLNDEYIADYQDDVAECNKKLNELLADTVEIELITYDMEAVYDALPDDCTLGIDDMDILSFMHECDDCE